MPCIVCGRKDELENAHVKPKREFDEDENDLIMNIIELCANHHTMFDNNLLGICPDREKVVLMKSGELQVTNTVSKIGHVKDQYIEYRNNMCVYEIRLALGMVTDQLWNNLCK